ncbi:MAG: Gfo/Idh/MocA family oxidoreductase [Candidatus Eisenbacteria bacterium]|uniref:Gfo/Idh/MocA family oxidoreductase n=1 Tax=Eiseniibacteriota bacterium TaxID=2212470 RepID=A0A948RY12_UNCEI|nr:Gfo/Idh/MocA family oxidoreductase [Candidatus Eisenbacteria bacterium]MBU1947523.1 Gfo/Idh/MocA family oxidoreductase [Candidatus Eisenbacteria bacterium]MBU2691679.1 Gfo/Idh/MocA family oxidoreductase [Candidatus Eisenbacteria bacterium]
MKKPGIAVIGAGAWGKNIVRNFNILPTCDLRALCDTDPSVLAAHAATIPNAVMTQNVDEVLSRDDVHGVAIAAQAVVHADLAGKALSAGKDVFVEKPLTLSTADALDLCRLADEKGRVLMVGHLLLYHPAILQMLDIIKSGELGEIRYLTAQRVNLGTVRKDENALWSLAPHDLSIIGEIFNELPVTVSARGAAYLRPGVEDVVFLSLRFPNDHLAHVHLSWLDPHKERRMTLVGSQKMLAFDDMQVQEKIRIYDKGVGTSAFVSYDESLTVRNGDIWIPRIKMGEPLRTECQEFIDCINDRRTPKTDGWSGLRVVQLLEAAQTSLDRDGEPITVNSLQEQETAS